MHPRRAIARALSLSLLATCLAFAGVPLGTGFTYQGQLKKNGSPVNGTVNLRFGLWDNAGSGTPPVGGLETGNQLVTAVPVSNGVFTVTLNASGQFGQDAISREARWLQITV